MKSRDMLTVVVNYNSTYGS